LKTVFESFDTDKSGSISVSELFSVFKALGFKVNDSDLNSIMKMMDHDKSGCVDFKVILNKTLNNINILTIFFYRNFLMFSLSNFLKRLVKKILKRHFLISIMTVVVTYLKKN
jgi:hypothetical protein